MGLKHPGPLTQRSCLCTQKERRATSGVGMGPKNIVGAPSSCKQEPPHQDEKEEWQWNSLIGESCVYFLGLRASPSFSTLLVET